MRYKSDEPISLIPAQPIFSRVRLDQFVGRTWFFNLFDTFLTQNSHGYFLLEAEAGLGKTTLLAYLARQRQYIHLFVEQTPGLDNLADGLRNLAAQVVQTWKLQPWCTDDTVPGIPMRPDFLQRLLTVAAYHRDYLAPDQPVVLLIDDIERTGNLPGQNNLGLPTTLPKGVYVLLSQSPEGGACRLAEKVDTGTVLQRYTLHADAPEHQADLQHYLRNAAQRPAIKTFLRQHGYGTEQFTATLLQKSGGSWAYLRYVLEKIEQQNETSAPLDALPDDLCASFSDYWYNQPSANTPDQAVRKTLFMTLCAVQERVSLETLHGFVGKEYHLTDLLALLEQWQPLLTVEKDGELHYATDHSCCDFIGHQCSARQYSQELYQAWLEAHHKIANRYLKAWGDLDYELPWLMAPPLRDKDEGYGLRHIVAHLKQAGRPQDIHRLMSLEWVVSEQQVASPPEVFQWLYQILAGTQADSSRTLYLLKWYVTREQEGDLADFLADVVQAWETTEPPWEAATVVQNMALQCRYALMYTSLLSLSQNLPLPLLVALVDKGIWRPAQMLVYIREILDETRRAAALKSVAAYFPTSLMDNALAVARAIRDERERWKAIVGMAAYMPQPLLVETLDIARRLNHPGWRVMALVGLLQHLPEEIQQQVVPEALQTTRTVWHTNFRVETLSGLAPYLSEPLQRQALDMAREIIDPDWRALALIALARYLPTPMFREALHLWETWSPFARAKVLAELSPRLPELGENEHILNMVRSISNPYDRTNALAGLVPNLPRYLLDSAVEIASSFAEDAEKTQALMVLVPYLSRIHLRQLQITAREMQERASGLRLLLALMPYLPDEEHMPLFKEMREGVDDIEERTQRDRFLVELATSLARLGYLPEVVQTIELLKDQRQRTRVLVNLAPYLPEKLQYMALSRVRMIDNTHQRSGALAKLAPYLSTTLLLQALDIARAIGDSNEQAHTLAAMFPFVSLPLQEKIFAHVRGVSNEQQRAHMLVSLASSYAAPRQSAANLPRFPLDDGSVLFPRMVEAARGIRAEDYRATALAGLASAVPSSLQQRLLEAGREIEHEHDRARALTGIVPHLPEHGLRTAWNAAKKFADEQYRAQVIAVLVPRLPVALHHELLAEVRKLSQAEYRDMLLQATAPTIAHYGSWQQAFDAAWGITRTDERGQTLARLVPYLPRVLLKQVMSAVRSIRQEDVLAKTLAEMREHLPPEDRPYIFDQVLHHALAARWKGASSPGEIVPLLAKDGPIEKVLESVQTLMNPGERVRAISELAPYLPSSLKKRALNEAVEDVKKVWEQDRARIMALLAPVLPQPLLLRLLEQAQTLEREEWQIKALTDLLPYLPPSLRNEVVQKPLTAARSLTEKTERAEALIHLLPFVLKKEYPELCQVALAATRDIEAMETRSRLLSSLARYLARLDPELLATLWSDSLHLLATRTRHDVLADIHALLPVVQALTGKTNLDEVAGAVLDVGRWFT
jgi:hypothetical protein